MGAPQTSNDGAPELDGRHIAAQDAINAMHEKSPEKLRQALMNFMDLHNMHNDETSTDDLESSDFES